MRSVPAGARDIPARHDSVLNAGVASGLDLDDDPIEELFPWQFQMLGERRYTQYIGSKIAHLEQRLKHRPNDTGLLLKLGRAKYYLILNQKLEMIPQARETFDRILKLQPNHPAALAYHGSLLLWEAALSGGNQTATQQRGLAEMARAVQLAPDDLEVRAARGMALLYSDIPARDRWAAVEDFNKSILLMRRLTPDPAASASFRLALGDVYFTLGRISEAHAQWQRVLDEVHDPARRQGAEVRLRYRQGVNRAQRVEWRDLLALLALLLSAVSLVVVAVQPLRARSWRRLPLSMLALALGITSVAEIAELLVRMVRGSALSPVSVTGDVLLAGAVGMLIASLGLLRLTREPLADAILKRGSVAVLFAVATVALFQYVLAPVSWNMLAAGAGALFTVLVAAVWTGLAVSFPFVQRGVSRFVDRRLFHREESTRFLSRLATRLSTVTSEPQLAEIVQAELRDYLRVRFIRWTPLAPPPSGSEADPAEEAARLALLEMEKRHAETLVRVNASAGGLAPVERLWGDLQRVLLLRATEGPPIALLVGGGRALLSGDDEVLGLVGRQVSSGLENLRLHDAVRQRAVAQESLARLATQAELRALRAQIHPHFLFNTLNSIAGLIAIEPRHAEELVEELAELLRYRFREGREFIPLSEELSLVNSYLKIEQVRLGGRLRIVRDVEAAALAVPVPPLLLQPLVENAVTHGVARRVEGGEVRIEARIVGERLELRVEDDGSGMSTGEAGDAHERSPSYGGSGVGLPNVLARLHRIYGEQARAQVESEPGHGTRIRVELPLVPPALAVPAPAG